MSRRLAIYVLVAMMALVPGCQCLRQMSKGWESQTAGLRRSIKLYDYTGRLIASWNSKTVIDADSGGLTTFFDSTGCRVLINGGILVAVETP